MTPNNLNNTQAPTPVPVVFAGFIGIDWADEAHAYTLVANAPGAKPERGSVKQTPEALEQWLKTIQDRFPNQIVAVAVEQKKGPLLSFLAGQSGLRIFPVNPLTAAKFRQALHPSGSKSDPRDSDLLLELLQLHRDKLTELFRPDDQTRLLARLTEDRRSLVDQRTKLTQELTAVLKEFYPLALRVGGSFTTGVGPAFLMKWPTLAELQDARSHVLRKFLYGHKSQARVEERIQEIKEARPLTQDTILIETGRRRVLALVPLIASLNATIKQYDDRINEVFRLHPDYELFNELPAGPVLKPRVMAEFGTDRSRYDSAFELQCISGVAPVQRTSGKNKTVHMRVACPHHTRQTFLEFAAISLRFSAWAKALYEWKRQQGHNHNAALRAVAFKWQRILFACWQYSKPYNEADYIKKLTAKKVPYLHLIQPENSNETRPVKK